MDEEERDSWERIDGLLTADIDPVSGKVSHRWEGGVVIGMSRDYLQGCDRTIVAFEGEMPQAGDEIHIGGFNLRAFKWDGNLLLCVRERFADEGMVPA